MTRDSLDILYQETILNNCGYKSLLGGKATLVHHFKPKSGGLSLRWYVPNGIPLTLEQHNRIHGVERNQLESEIYKIKGEDWKHNLIYQSNRIMKNVNFDKVKLHILGINENYN